MANAPRVTYGQGIARHHGSHLSGLGEAVPSCGGSPHEQLLWFPPLALCIKTGPEAGDPHRPKTLALCIKTGTLGAGLSLLRVKGSRHQLAVNPKEKFSE